MEWLRALGALCEPPQPEHTRIAESLGLGTPPDATEATNLFLFHVYPYASVHLNPDGMLGGEARDRIAGFWRAVGQAPPTESDHLGALLGLLAALSEGIAGDAAPDTEADRALLEHARGTLLDEHLLTWLPAFTSAVGRLDSDFYHRWAGLLRDGLVDMAQAVDAQPDAPVWFEQIPELVDPRIESGKAFLEGLFAPAVSGLVIARADLARAARELDLGFRLGERQYQIKALLSQDPGATLAWMAEFARAQQSGIRAEWWGSPAVGRLWADRAGRTASLLAELAATDWAEAVTA